MHLCLLNICHCCCGGLAYCTQNIACLTHKAIAHKNIFRQTFKLIEAPLIELKNYLKFNRNKLVRSKLQVS